MVNIILDDKYTLTSDTMNYILEETKVIQGGEKKGETYKTVFGYYSTIESAMRAYKELKIRTSEAETIDELLSVARETDRQVKKILGNI